MPQDDIGLPKELDPKLRDSILRTAQAFRDELVQANLWEATQGVVALSLPNPAPGESPLLPLTPDEK